MNSKTVLNKILTLLAKEEVKLTYAKLADGTIVESPTFDVGERVDVVTEDGKVPAPDGEHELALRDEEGNEVLIKVETKDGVITERENVELPESEEERVEENLESIAGADMGGDSEEDETTETAEPLTEDMMKSVVEKLAYRIEELEKKITAMEEVKEEVVDKKADIEEELEEELPKLDGAPREEDARMKRNFSKTNVVRNTQSTVLSKLYSNN
jgi:hypothetical protein